MRLAHQAVVANHQEKAQAMSRKAFLALSTIRPNYSRFALRRYGILRWQDLAYDSGPCAETFRGCCSAPLPVGWRVGRLKTRQSRLSRRASSFSLDRTISSQVIVDPRYTAIRPGTEVKLLCTLSGTLFRNSPDRMLSTNRFMFNTGPWLPVRSFSAQAHGRLPVIFCPPCLRIHRSGCRCRRSPRHIA